ncbi:MAG: hypothetical protein ACRDD7_07125 [Peptostreptococcaceae bacterium]
MSKFKNIILGIFPGYTVHGTTDRYNDYDYYKFTLSNGKNSIRMGLAKGTYYYKSR